MRDSRLVFTVDRVLVALATAPAFIAIAMLPVVVLVLWLAIRRASLLDTSD